MIWEVGMGLRHENGRRGPSSSERSAMAWRGGMGVMNGVAVGMYSGCKVHMVCMTFTTLHGS